MRRAALPFGLPVVLLGVVTLGTVSSAPAFAAGGSGAAGAREAADASGAEAFLDGARRVLAERIGPPRREPRVRDAATRRGEALLTPVRLSYPGREPVDAHVGGTAIVAVDPRRPGQGGEPGTEAWLAGRGVRLVRPLMPSAGLWLAADEAGADGLALAARLASDEARAAGVRRAFPNLYVRARAAGGPTFTPDDPRLSGQWYFENLEMEKAWGLTQGDPETTIVVVDTGCDGTHVDLVDKLDPGWDVVDDDDDPSPAKGADGAAHGTECAGLVGAATNNGEGIAGGCPACRVRCVRMLTDEPLPISANIDAFELALEVGASVVSNSWGFADPIPVPKVLADAIENVYDTGRGGKGTLVLFAAGNDDREIADDELQGVRGVLCIGAVNNFDDTTPFTNYGASVDLVAPTGTLTTDLSGPAGDDPSDYTTLFGGTSSACPVAAGIAGLLVGAAPQRTAEDLYAVMIAHARPAPYAVPDQGGHDPYYGYGIVDPVPALRDVLGLPPEEEETPDAGAGGAPPDAGDAGGATEGAGGGSAGQAQGDAGDAGCACRAGDTPPRSGLEAAYSVAALAFAIGARRRPSPKRRTGAHRRLRAHASAAASTAA